MSVSIFFTAIGLGSMRLVRLCDIKGLDVHTVKECGLEVFAKAAREGRRPIGVIIR